MLSFWEQDAITHHDLIIVGGGLIGLLSALECQSRKPKAHILVLERGLLPLGASSRNAGFACFGSLTELLSDIQRMGQDAALNLLERRFRGLHVLRQKLGDESIGYEHFGGFELLMEAQVSALLELPHMNAILRPIFKSEVFIPLKDRRGTSASGSLGFNPKIVRAIIRNPFEGQLHSGKLMNTLHRLCVERGIEIRSGANVAAIDQNPNHAVLQVQHGLLPETVAFHADQVLLCTNGFTEKLLPDVKIAPARGQILVTEPLKNLPWHGAFHADEGFIYFRNITCPEGDRVLLGGARNMAFEAERSSELELTETIQNRLEQLLRDVILPGRSPKIEHRWSGVMGFSEDKKPLVKRLSNTLSIAFGCNGMGVALGPLIAQDAATLMMT
jgi:glycine/D-amino acid oxidase-like deaminating enzyme